MGILSRSIQYQVSFSMLNKQFFFNFFNWLCHTLFAHIMNNPNPKIFSTDTYTRQTDDDLATPTREPIDSLEIYEHIRYILDPEHPLTLEQLRIVTPDDIFVDDENGAVEVVFTPTVKNCSMPAILGLCIREKLLRVLPLRFHSKIRISVAKEKHEQEEAINRQLRDKERCLAALEKSTLRDTIEKCIMNYENVSD